jgi:uncharacterized protein (DUF2267 family)
MEHISAAAKYLARCRRSGDTRPTLELLRDVLSAADAAAYDAALHEIAIDESGRA